MSSPNPIIERIPPTNPSPSPSSPSNSGQKQQKESTEPLELTNIGPSTSTSPINSNKMKSSPNPIIEGNQERHTDEGGLEENAEAVAEQLLKIAETRFDLREHDYSILVNL